ncbi:MAG: hypothetical protein GWP03_04450, partial [Proteobacteria bacterium]|nr:hypothetical protein [Pseudomonadota bacterium]
MIKNSTVLFLFLLLELFTSCSFFWEIPPKLSYTYVKDTANTYENIVIKAAAKDNNNGLLSYQINFGDNHISHWSSYLPQNETLKVYHQYINSGEYKIKLRVKNRDGILSYWSDPLFIKISDNSVKPPLGKLWGGLNKDSGIKIIKTNDGGYFVAGNTESFGENASDIVLIRLDNQGNIQWTKILGEYNNNKCSDIIETSDGGFILVAYRHGTSFLSTDETYIIKLNSIGYMEWENDYEYVNTKGSRISSIAEISDGYILAGIYETPINLSEYCSVGGYMFKISKDGEFLWQTEGPYDPFVESQLYSVLNLGGDTILYTGNNGDNLYYAEFLNDSSHSA